MTLQTFVLAALLAYGMIGCFFAISFAQFASEEGEEFDIVDFLILFFLWPTHVRSMWNWIEDEPDDEEDEEDEEDDNNGPAGSTR